METVDHAGRHVTSLFVVVLLVYASRNRTLWKDNSSTVAKKQKAECANILPLKGYFSFGINLGGRFFCRAL